MSQFGVSIILATHPVPCPESPPDLLAAAREYSRRGWSVVPVSGKIARIPWTRYQKTRPSYQVLSRWFSRADVTGLAVISGAVSGGLCCRDFDAEGSYAAWAAAHPDLAATLPTDESSPGRNHVFFRIAAEQFLDLGDGELRGTSGQYTLIAPSAHPDGHRYRWLIPPADDPLPLIDPVAAGLIPPPTLSCGVASDTSIACVHSSTIPISKVCESQVREAIRTTVPDGPGRRNRALFDFARRLKAIPELRGRTPLELEGIVRDWFAAALPTIGTKDWRTTWDDFTTAWARAKYSHGLRLDGIAAQVQQLIPGRSVADDLDRLDLALELLDDRHNGEPFPLSVRIAARLAGVGKSWAARLLRRLVRAGVLELHTEADRKSKLARTWKYTGAQILRMADRNITETGRATS